MSERPTGPPPAPPPPLGPPSAPSLPQFHLPVQRLDDEEEEAAVLEAAEQVRASQQLTDEQLGQLMRKTRSAGAQNKVMHQGCSYPSSTISWCKHKHSTQQQQRGE